MRWSVLWIALVLCGSLGQLSVAQDKTAPKKGESKMLTTKDGWNLAITYYQSTREKDAAVVVLVPGKNDNQAMWAAFAADLNKVHDFAVITVDLRKQPKGKTTPPMNAVAAAKNPMVSKFDVEAMIALDLEQVKRFIYEEHQEKKLNMRRLALVGSDTSTAIVLQYAGYDWSKLPHDDAPTLAARTPKGQDVQAVVLLSPVDQLTGINLAPVLPQLKLAGVACMQVYGTKNKKDVEVADKFYQALGGLKDKPKDDKEKEKAAKQLLLPIDNAVTKGIELLTKPVVVGNQQVPVSTLIGGFLAKNIKEVEIEWRDRKSKLD